MVKSNSFAENTNVSSLESFITQALLKGENVIIPDFGHLELKSFGERRTVLFKPTIEISDSSFLQVMSSDGTKAKNNNSAVYSLITLPLKEEKTVNLPKVGVFRPTKRETGEIHVSFTPSSYLRNLLNGKEEEIKNEPVNEKPDEVKKDISEIKALSTSGISAQNDPVKDIAVNNNIRSAPATVIKPETVFPKRSGFTPKPNSNVVDTQKSGFNKGLSQVDDKPENGRPRLSASWILLLTVAAIFLLVFIITNVYSHHSKKNDGTPQLIIPSESVSLPALAEQHYGHSAFWIYIYRANMDKLSSPINIPKNVSLVFPDLKTEYQVDVNDSMEIRRANILADIILKEGKNLNNDIYTPATNTVITAVVDSVASNNYENKEDIITNNNK